MLRRTHASEGENMSAQRQADTTNPSDGWWLECSDALQHAMTTGRALRPAAAVLRVFERHRWLL